MKNILIDGVIGFDSTPHMLRRQLEDANGDEIQIDISSPGGFVYDGLEMFNLIRDYSKQKNRVTTRIMGLAASMASYLALAGDKVTADDNAVYMIHNVWGFSIGDYKQLQKDSKEFESLSNLLAKEYSKKTRKPITDIRKLMDDETFYYGDESKIHGFVDEILKTDTQAYDKDGALIVASSRIKNCFNKISESEKSKNDMQKASALIQSSIEPVANDNPVVIEPKTEGKKNMNLEELQRNHPDLYNQVVTIGVEQERSRVNAHITLGKAANAVEKSIEFIQSGKNIADQQVQADYMAAGMVNKIQTARSEENPVAIQTEDDHSNDLSDTEKYAQELKRRRGIK